MARPRASRDKAPRQTAARKMAAQAAAEGMTPLALMLEVMREHYAAGDRDKAVAIAEKAAPYVHAKLAQVDASLRAEVRADHRFVLVGSTEAPDAVSWERWCQEVQRAEPTTHAETDASGQMRSHDVLAS